MMKETHMCDCTIHGVIVDVIWNHVAIFVGKIQKCKSECLEKRINNYLISHAHVPNFYAFSKQDHFQIYLSHFAVYFKTCNHNIAYTKQIRQKFIIPITLNVHIYI